MMSGDFGDELLGQWCELYVRYAGKDSQRLAAVVHNCRDHKKFQKCLLPGLADLNAFLERGGKTDDDYLAAYGYLQKLDDRFWQKPHPHLLNGCIEKSVADSRYVLMRSAEHPIVKAIPEDNRFKLNKSLGINGWLPFRHHWREVEHSTELDIRRSEVFDAFPASQASVKIGLSPFAGYRDMNWRYDAEDRRGDGRIPFWCSGARDEAGLLDRLVDVLAAAHAGQVHILLFPELVMTEKLQAALSGWLEKHNAFEPVIRLIVAGTRHIFHADKPNTYSNRCTVFNHIGDIEWEQEKRQPFDLTAEAAGAVLGVQTPAYEPTCWSQRLAVRHTALGKMATPICLDFLVDKLWEVMPVDVFLVPAMSPGLRSFEDNCRKVGKSGAAAFVCNARPDTEGLAYRPARDALRLQKQTPFLFTVAVDMDMNYS